MTSFYLVVDEPVPVGKFQFRVRRWRQAGFPPLVLYTQSPGQPAPRYFSSYLGNFVVRSFLGCAVPIPVFFDLSKAREESRAFRVCYETIGRDLRPILHKPKFTLLIPSAVEKLFGVKLDTFLKESP
jgi:hypothetical protein